MFQICISINSMTRNNQTNSFELTCSVTYITSGGTTSKILLSMSQSSTPVTSSTSSATFQFCSHP